MKFTAFALATVAAATEDALNFKFMKFVMDHQKEYTTLSEFETRFNIFADTEAQIVAFNSGNETYTLGHNQFSDMTQEERAVFRGRLPTPAGKVHETYHVVGDYPATWDWRDHNAVTPVKDQGQCGSCWAFSSTGAMEGAVAVKYGVLDSFSEQELVDCVTADYGCNGGLQIDAFAYLATHDMILEKDYAYTATGGLRRTCYYDSKPHTTYETAGAGYTQVEANNVAAMKSAVALQPLAVAIEADQFCFQMYSSGIFNNAKCGTNLDHATLVVGYGVENGTEFWIMKNSWNTTWGEKGYMRLQITGDDAGICGIQSDTQYPNLQ